MNFNIIKMPSIRITKKLKTNKSELVDISIITNKQRKRGYKNLYEYINPHINIYVKPYFDIDDNNKSLDINKVYVFLNRVFGSETNDWAVSTDHRKSKKSYHLVLSNVKTTIQDLIDLKTDEVETFKELKIDPQVYRNGDSKFRTIYSIKENDKTSKGFIPSNHLKDLNSHIISYVNEKCKIWKYNKKNKKEKKQEDNKDDKTLKLSKEQQEILKKYKIKGSIHKKGNYKTCDIDVDCPFGNTHSNNNRYLIITKNEIKLKCWSEKCSDEKLIWKKDGGEDNFDILKLTYMKLDDKDQKQLNELEKKMNELICNDELKMNVKKNKIKELKNQILKLKDNLYLKQKTYFEKYHSRIDNPLCVVKKSYSSVMYYKISEMKNLYYNINKGLWIDKWLSDPHLKSCNSVDFLPPPMKTPKHIYNTFDGIQMDNYDCETEDFIEYLNHINILVNHDEKSYNYVLDWLAHLFQRLGELPRVALLFKSDQGVGKNLFFEMLIGDMMLGEKYWIQTAEMEKIIGRFNMLDNKFLVLLDETNGKDSFLNSEKLKNIITSNKIPFEKKNINVIKINNCGRYVFFSNNATPIKIEISDRRFVVFDCDNSKCNNKKYFSNLIKAIQNKKKVYGFYKFLMNRDISNWDSINDRPKTKLYNDIQSVNIPLPAQFLSDYLLKKEEDDLKDGFFKIQAITLYNRFIDWKRNQGKRGEYSNTLFGRIIKKYKGIEKKRNLKGNFYILNKAEILDYFKSKNYLQESECLIIDTDVDTDTDE